MDIGLAHLQTLDLGVLTVSVLVIASIALVVLEPVLGQRDYRAFLREEAEHGETARVRFYRRWVLHGCVSAAAALVVVASLPGVELVDLGLRWPDLSVLAGSGHAGSPSRGLVIGLVLGGTLALVGGTVVGIVTARRSRGADTPGTTLAGTPSSAPDPRLVALAPMLPRTAAGRRWWAALSLSAGVTEEITFRGLLLLTLAVALPTTTPGLVLVLVAAALFGVAHWYQGRAGIIGTGVLGALLAVAYLVTGSLLLPIVLHTLIDLRVLLVPATAVAQAQEPARHA